MNKADEFLRSSILSNPDADCVKSLVKLVGASILDASAPQNSGSVGKGSNVINVYRLVCFNLAGAERRAKNQGIRLARADGAGVNAHGFGEIAKKAISRLKVRHVDRVRI
jgi:hypothetical protein